MFHCYCVQVVEKEAKSDSEDENPDEKGEESTSDHGEDDAKARAAANTAEENKRGRYLLSFFPVAHHYPFVILLLC